MAMEAVTEMEAVMEAVRGAGVVAHSLLPPLLIPNPTQFLPLVGVVAAMLEGAPQHLQTHLQVAEELRSHQYPSFQVQLPLRESCLANLAHKTQQAEVARPYLRVQAVAGITRLPVVRKLRQPMLAQPLLLLATLLLH